MAETAVRIQQVALEEIIDLRHRMLRQGLPREAAVFEGDRDASALHFAAFVEDLLVGCATFHRNQWEGEPAWQLRGMAVSDSHQKAGVGAKILQFAESQLKTGNGSPLLWCNARVPASMFYVRLGWKIVSEPFEIPTAGPHVRMVKGMNGQ